MPPTIPPQKIHLHSTPSLLLPLTPSPISAIALNGKLGKLALFRTSHWIEIWDLPSTPPSPQSPPTLSKYLHDLEEIDDSSSSSKKQPSVEALVWANDRLFSCGLHGFVVEHCWRTGIVVSKSRATSGPVWCLAASTTTTTTTTSHLLAAGTEDGFINLFLIQENEPLTYLRVLDRQEGRVLTLSFSPCGAFIASGSLNSIRLWDVKKGHAVQKLNTGRRKRSKETIVWAVLVLEDLTIVAGDSRGLISFYNGSLGVLTSKIQTHKADVLALCYSPEEGKIYAAGVDPTVVLLQQRRGGLDGSNNKWVKSHCRNLHLNDVLCLGVVGGVLFSGGTDSDLILSSFPPRRVLKVPELMPAGRVHFCGAAGGVPKNPVRVLIQGMKELDIWDLDFFPEGGAGFAGTTTQNQQPKHLLKLLPTITPNSSPSLITAAALSPSNNSILIAYTTTLKKLHILQFDESTSTICKFRPQDEEESNISHLTFLQSSTSDKLLFGLHKNGKSASIFQLAVKEKTWSKVEDLDFDFDIGEEDDEENGEEASLLFSSTKSTVAFAVGRSVRILELFNGIKKMEKKSSPPVRKDSSLTVISLKSEYEEEENKKKKWILLGYADGGVVVWDWGVGRVLWEGGGSGGCPLRGAVWGRCGDTCVLYGCGGVVGVVVVQVEDHDQRSNKRKKKNEEIGTTNFHFMKSTNNSSPNYITAIIPIDSVENHFISLEVDVKQRLERLPPAAFFPGGSKSFGRG